MRGVRTRLRRRVDLESQAGGFIHKVEATGATVECGGNGVDEGRKRHTLYRMNPRGRDQRACHRVQTWDTRLVLDSCMLMARKESQRKRTS